METRSLVWKRFGIDYRQVGEEAVASFLGVTFFKRAGDAFCIFGIYGELQEVENGNNT